MQDTPQLSRWGPFGRECWIVKNNVKLTNELISMIKVDIGAEIFFYIFGACIPFDNGTVQRLKMFNSKLSFVESYVRANILLRKDLFIFMGVFNCDTFRNNRFDKIFFRFLNDNNFINSLNFFKSMNLLCL